ncbi:MAG: hypothetical protein M1832_006306 [Thelocarpon impressellum]|nr:MAG: hypothetical protein M1832_006306 [Thelocarpon impressellum]
MKIGLLALVFCTVASLGGALSSEIAAATAPDCAYRCWENSKFVSVCGTKLDCLCDDMDFQNAVFQCLYSQCQTAQFGSALHHAIAACPLDDQEDSKAAPRLIRGARVRKREYAMYSQVSGSSPRPSQSAVSQHASVSRVPSGRLQASARPSYVKTQATTAMTSTAVASATSGPTSTASTGP